ncbi:MAG: SAM-dependent methyltransferase [Eubacteriales bacterium]
MEKYLELIGKLIYEQNINRIVFSNCRNKSNPVKRVAVRPILIKNIVNYQCEFHTTNKVIHKNFNGDDFILESSRLIDDEYKQVNIFTESIEYQVFAGSRNSASIKQVKIDKAGQSPHSISARISKNIMSHDNKKNLILAEGVPCDFLVLLGVMREDGSVNKSHYNKFRQINRFLEIVDEVVSSLPKEKQLTIVDFGCGKAYLTFALYYYLCVKKGYDVEIVGLDLKEDVIEFCNKTAVSLKYTDLSFKLGDIADFSEFQEVDMVVTLHACDTATDFALIKAVKWNASVILSVPCCQHELFDQVKNTYNESLLKYGILKERFSSILTDGLRGLKLEEFGYDVKMLEFTSLTHTAKNIMIRGVRDNSKSDSNSKLIASSAKAKIQFDQLVEFWNVNPTISKMTR